MGTGQPRKKRGRSSGKAGAGDEQPVGRKKQKRIEKLQAKKARTANTSAAAAKKAADEAAQAVKGKAKAKDGQISKAATELIDKLRSGGPAGDRRLLATAAERIAAEPEKDLDLFDIFFHLHRVSKDRETRLMALLSGVAVFKDLVPGYRIREPTEQERAQIRSKPVLALERYELKLLQTYRRLLPDLEAAMRNHPVATAPALGALIKAAFDFNYRQRLIGTAIKHCNSPDKDVRAPLVAGLQEMVESDQRLEGSKEAVIAIGRLAQGMAGRKAKAGNKAEDASDNSQSHRGLHFELLQVLLRLPIGRADAAELAGPGGDMSNADDDVKKGLAEASITLSAEQLRKREGELLYEVFVVYLRILRQRHLHSRELMGTVLTGLARWGQQVNLELLLEILSELRLAVKDAIARGDELVALHGLNCALVLLSGPSQALLTDVSWLSDSMTSALALALPSMYSVHSKGDVWPPPRCFWENDDGEVMTSEKDLAEAMEGSSVPGLVLRCLHAALRCPQGYSTASDAALAALLEQLVSISVTADCHAALAFLREAALLLRRHRRLYSLLDMEGGIFGLGGVADKAVTLAWHFQGLSCSISPALASAAKVLPSSIPKRNEVIAELFPFKDSSQWLSSEVLKHFSAAEAIPKQANRKTSKFASFLSEPELRAACEMCE